MKTLIAEFPKHPLPQSPQPDLPRPRVQPPSVFVYERQEWEYRVINKAANEAGLSEGELNTLGQEGWELVGVVQAQSTVQFVFKRVK